MKHTLFLVALLAAGIASGVFGAASVRAQSQPRPEAERGSTPGVHVFRGATIYPISSEPIENGVLVVEGGQIQAVGPADAVDVPAGATEHDVTGRVLMPGLVDTHSHVGSVEGGERSGAMHPAVRGLDAVDVRDPSIDRARAGGITTVNVMPGSGHLMSGQTAYLKLREGDTISELLYCDDINEDICGGMKMANGTNPRGEVPFPGTRAKAAAMVRETFLEAQQYQQQQEVGGEEAPERDLGMEALGQVLRGERLVHFHTHRHDDILTALRLAEEFGFRVVLHHVSEGWKVADEIAEAGAAASIIVLDAPGGKPEAIDLIYKTGGVLEEAGVDVAYHTDDLITDSRLFLRSAAFGVRGGMSRTAALEAMTLAGARMMNMEDRIGSLEAGKDADFIVLSGDPLSVYTHVLQTWVEGRKVFDRANEEDRQIATGGPDVYRGAATHVHE